MDLILSGHKSSQSSLGDLYQEGSAPPGKTYSQRKILDVIAINSLNKYVPLIAYEII